MNINILKKRNKQTEHAIQSQFVKYMDLKHPLISKYLFAIPNGGARNVITGRRLKLEGVRRGIPDMLFSKPSYYYHGLYIEFKSKDGKMSNEQQMYYEIFKHAGYAFVVVKSVDEAINFMADYVSNKEIVS